MLRPRDAPPIARRVHSSSPRPKPRRSFTEEPVRHHPAAPAPYSRSDILHGLVIAAAVGSLLTAINLGPLMLVRPWDFPAEAPRFALDYLIPFLVASLGAILANRKARAALRVWEADAGSQ